MPISKNISKLRQRRRGFTIIEMLVVIAILAILVGMTVPALLKMKSRGFVTQAKSLIEVLKASLEEYASEYGDYPPTYINPFYEEDINPGIESALAALYTGKGGPFVELEDKYLANLDEDTAETNLTGWVFGDLALREIVDPWGNPLIYFHNRDYAYAQEITCGAQVMMVDAVENTTTTYYGLTSFQLRSMGPNSVDDGGNGDDITSW